MNGKRYLLSSLLLSDLTQVVFQSSGLGEPQRGEYAVVELHCDDKRKFFRYEMSSECVRFFTALYGLVSSVAKLRKVAPAFPTQAQHIEATVSGLATPSDLNSSANHSIAVQDSLLGQRDLGTFKRRLQEGFLVEKVRSSCAVFLTASMGTNQLTAQCPFHTAREDWKTSSQDALH